MLEVAILGLEEFGHIFSKDLRADHPVPPQFTLVAADHWDSGQPWTMMLFAQNDASRPHSASGSALTLESSASELLLTLWGRASNVDPQIAAAIAAVDLS